MKVQITRGSNNGIFHSKRKMWWLESEEPRQLLQSWEFGFLLHSRVTFYRLCGSFVMIWRTDDETLCHTGQLKSAVRQERAVCLAEWLITSLWRRCYNYSSTMLLYLMLKRCGFLLASVAGSGDSLRRCSSVLGKVVSLIDSLVGAPQGHAGGTLFLGWPGNASESPRKSWMKWLGRRKSGLPCSGCCPSDPTKDKRWKMDGEMDGAFIELNILAD